jgi:hypothetical protein
MCMAIYDTANNGITLANVCHQQGHNMNSIADAAGTRIFSDNIIEAVINNIIYFVYGNSKQDLNTHLRTAIINKLSVIELNNLMHEAAYLPDWKPTDAYDIEYLNELMQTAKEDEEAPIDVLYTSRGQWHDVEDPL